MVGVVVTIAPSSTKTLDVLAWPYRRSTNPYTRDLYDTMRDVGPRPVTVDDLRFTDAWRRNVDVVHVHWPEAAVESSSVARATLKTIALLGTLWLLRRRGAVLVWTAHNLASHERRHPRIEAALRQCFFAMVDGVIHLSPGSVDEVTRTVPALERTPAAVVRHGMNVTDGCPGPSKRAAREALGIGERALVWLVIGTIRPYKQVPALVRAFNAARLPASQLIVAGRPMTPATTAEVTAAASGSPCVLLALDWLSPADFARYVAAADVVVAAYEELHNSGVVISALAQGRPVLCRRSPATEDLQALVGSEWLALVDGPPTAALLEEHARWAGATRDPRPPLDELHPAVVARETLEGYERFIALRRSRMAD
jgi:glycosyltransferase involved in cell wall biosynthesis